MLSEKENGHIIRIFRSDNGTEFVNDELGLFFDEKGIYHQCTVPYTPEQNGCAEREMRTIVESARTMIHSKQLDKKFWAEAVSFAVHVLNRTGTSTVEAKSPYELWYNKEAKIDHLRIFGSDVFVHIPKQKRQKLDAKAVKCVFVGYDNHSKGYRVWNPDSNKVEVARDVIFLAEESQAVFEIGDVEEPADENTNVDGESNEGDSDIEETPENHGHRGATCDLDKRNIIQDLRLRSQIKLSQRRLFNHDTHLAMLTANEEPITYEQAIESTDREQWEKAMKEEYDSLNKNRTWCLVKPPIGQKVIDNRWVFKLKENTDGSVERYKARLVARGFTQEYGVDYKETFSPVVKFTSIRTIMALAASKQMKLMHFDVKTAFLYGDLEETVYMKQPKGYDDESGRVCKLMKSLYGLKQASRCWSKKFASFIQDFDFRGSQSDPCIFIYNGQKGVIILAMYVDDGMLAAEREDAIVPVIKHLRKEFEIKFFEAKCFLGLEIDQRSDGSIHLNQKAYINKILGRFGFLECNPVATPLDST